MADAGHPFSVSAYIDGNCERLPSTSDTTALNWLLKSCKLTIGGSPSASTENGFSSTVVQNATGDYTLNFASVFSAVPTVLSILPISTTALGSGVISAVVYSVSTSQLRIVFCDAAGTLIDPDSAHVAVIGA